MAEMLFMSCYLLCLSFIEINALCQIILCRGLTQAYSLFADHLHVDSQTLNKHVLNLVCWEK